MFFFFFCGKLIFKNRNLQLLYENEFASSVTECTSSKAIIEVAVHFCKPFVTDLLNTMPALVFLYLSS